MVCVGSKVDVVAFAVVVVAAIVAVAVVVVFVVVFLNFMQWQQSSFPDTPPHTPFTWIVEAMVKEIL